MIWFAVFLFPHVAGAPALQQAFAAERFRSESVCLALSATKASEAARIGLHGRFLCMYHGEPGARLLRARKVGF